MSWRRVVLTIAALVPVIGLLAFGLTRDPGTIESPLPGRAAPSFALPVVADPLGEVPSGTASLADHAGEVVVLNFWASWCLACRGEHDDLSRAADRFRGRGVHFYGVVYNDSPENARRWIGQMGGQSYPALADDGSATAIDYGLYGVPETFVIGPDGRVAFKQVGPVTEAQLAGWIESLLPAAGGGA